MVMKRKKPTVAGMYLWEVEVEYDRWPGGKTSSTVRVLTRTVSVTLAIQKAQAYVRHNRYDFPGWKIIGAARQGQIQA